MRCPHCRAANQQTEERCVHCGRRLKGEAPVAFPIRPGAAPATAQGTAVSAATAAAPALDPFPGPERLPGKTTLPLHPETPSYQPSLFRDGFREGSAGNKVIPIPTLPPLHPYHRGAARDLHQRRPSPRASAPARPQHRRHDFQQTLGFHDSAPEVRVQPGETIDCDAPVAAPMHRLVATVVDASLILVGLGVFLAIFFLSGGQVSLDRQALSFIIGVTAVIALFYRALWCLANGDTPGMRVAGLRLVDFDGRRPDREQRGIRQVASVLSLLSAGLGLLWALVDEENLTWHDHISKTFPTTN